MKSKTTTVLASITPYLPTDITTIEGCLDFRDFREQLVAIDRLLRTSGIEEDFIEGWLASLSGKEKRSVKSMSFQQEHASRGLRCTFLKVLLTTDYRDLSVRLGDSQIMRWFIGMADLRDKRTPSKSTLERYEKQVGEPVIRAMVEKLVRMATGEAKRLELDEALKIDEYYLDLTCVKGMIHFPVDWVLLRDGVRSLIQSIVLIRKRGLIHRMPDPKDFLKQINRESIAMTMQSRRKDSKRNRKAILRKMKKIVSKVEEHGKRYRDLLDARWEETDMSRAQVEVVLGQMDRILNQLPEAIHQAHERIIGGRQVKNEGKILSLYESEMNVIVRGKAGAATEFGNTLRLGESIDGLIIDWKLYRNQAPSDTKVANEGIKKVMELYPGKIKSLVMDRGGESEANEKTLKILKVENGICPRDPRKLSEKLRDPEFRRWQKRRAQTEARISIFKNCFLGRQFRSKGFEHRELLVSWGVLVHNLWVIARLKIKQERRRSQEEVALAA